MTLAEPSRRAEIRRIMCPYGSTERTSLVWSDMFGRQRCLQPEYVARRRYRDNSKRGCQDSGRLRSLPNDRATINRHYSVTFAVEHLLCSCRRIIGQAHRRGTSANGALVGKADCRLFTQFKPLSGQRRSARSSRPVSAPIGDVRPTSGSAPVAAVYVNPANR